MKTRESKMLRGVFTVFIAVYASAVFGSLVGWHGFQNVWGLDKAAHFVFSFAAGLVWFPLCLLLNASKELLDVTGGQGQPDFMDMVWGIAGGLLGWLFRRAHQREQDKLGKPEPVEY